MELVKLVKDVPKDIIDGTGACPVKFRRTVQRISLGPALLNSSQKTSGANLTGAVQKTKTKRANSTPFFVLHFPG